MADDLIPQQRLRAMQIIAGALPAGVIMFLGIVLFLVFGQANAPPQMQNLPIVSILAAGFLVIAGSMSFIVPQIITQTALQQLAAQSAADDVGRLLALRQTTLMIGLALLEGAAFFGLVAFLTERQPLALIVPGIALFGMLMRFPTENSVRNWMELNGRRVLELRQDRGVS